MGLNCRFIGKEVEYNVARPIEAMGSVEELMIYIIRCP